jgi:hypothetical protein
VEEKIQKGKKEVKRKEKVLENCAKKQSKKVEWFASIWKAIQDGEN